MAAISEREDGEEHLDIRLRQDEEMEFFTELALHEAERWISVSEKTYVKLPPVCFCVVDTIKKNPTGNTHCKCAIKTNCITCIYMLVYFTFYKNNVAH